MVQRAKSHPRILPLHPVFLLRLLPAAYDTGVIVRHVARVAIAFSALAKIYQHVSLILSFILALSLSLSLKSARLLGGNK